MRGDDIRDSSRVKGFTLIEMMLVVTVISILCLIAYPNYQDYSKLNARTVMMTQLQNQASHIHRQKLIRASDVQLTLQATDDASLYSVSLTHLIDTHWILIAIPIEGSKMSGDGILSIDAFGQRCHRTQCGNGNEWR